MQIEIVVRAETGIVFLPPGARSRGGTVLGAVIDGSYYGDIPEDVRAAMLDETHTSHWRGIRERLGMSQGQLARAVGCTQAAVSTWEKRGADPRHDIRQKILALL